MRFGTRGLSSILAIAGGALFLVLPVAFLNGTVSVYQPPPPPPPPCVDGYCHIIEIYRPISLPVEMAAFSVILGGVGILLGLLALVMRVKPRPYLMWGLPFSLGSESLLFSIVTLYIQGKYLVSPIIYSLFLSIGTIAMVGSTLLLTFGLAMSNYPRTIDDDRSPQKAGHVL